MDGAFGADRYAYPYYGYGHGWTPGSTYQDLPFEASEVEQLERFDYAEMEAYEE